MHKPLYFPSRLLLFICFFLSSFASALSLQENDTGFCAFNGSIQSIYLGASNNQYVNLSNDAGKGITWAVQAAQSGSYGIVFRYASSGTQSATKAAIRINGVVVSHGLPFPSTGDWNNWQETYPFTVFLNAGNNTIRLETIAATEFANIDGITIAGVGLTAGACSGAGSPKTPHNGVISNPQSPVLASTPSPSQNIDKARAFPAEFNVSSGGQANYSFNVITAPGSGGLVPEVELSYSSGSGNGILGLGWTLNAGGEISRCRQTEGQDKNAMPITWSEQDRFCLNGQRLLVVSGNYGAPGSVYYTEVDNFSRVTAVGGTIGHPNYFTVESKNGFVETYGDTSQSLNSQYRLDSLNIKTVLSWHISRRVDSAGNKIEFQYASDTSGHRLTEIDYAYGSSLTPGAYIYFNYADRNDPISGYVSGYFFNSGKKISSIRSINVVDGVPQEIRSYVFTYNQNSARTTNDNLSRIGKVEECVNSFCPSFAEFEWNNFEQTIDSVGASSSFFGGVSDYSLGDINGDGLEDLIWLEQAKTKDLHDNLYKRSYRSALGRLNSEGKYFFDTGNAYVSPPNFDTRNLHVIDTNNDGIANIIADGVKDISENYIDMNGDGMVDRVRFVDGARPWDSYYTPLNTVEFATKTAGQATTSPTFYHFQGGGLRQHFDNTDHIPSATNIVWEDQSYFQAASGNQPGYDYMYLAPIRFFWSFVGDFNGSGRMDVVADTYANLTGCTDDGNVEGCDSVYSRPSIYTVQKPNSTESNWANGLELKYFNAGIPYMANRAIPVDLNGDGLTDMVVGTGSTWYFRLSNGLELGPQQFIGVPSSPFSTTDKVASDVAVVDFNGDGYPDFIWHSPNEPFNSSIASSGSGTIKVRYWNPALNQFEIEEHLIKSEPYSVLTNYGDARFGWNNNIGRLKTTAINMVDLDGDGRLDLVISPTTQTGSITVYKGIGNTVPTNKVVSIRNNLGDQIYIDYEAVNSSSHYIGGNKIYGVGQAQMCTTLNRGDGDYSAPMCWQVSAPTTQDDFYRNINDPWSALTDSDQALKMEAPVSVAIGPMFVVTSTAQSLPSANNAGALSRTGYFYENARSQALGRGFLGFGSFTKVNRETGIRERTTFRQDWPYIGAPLRVETFTEKGYLLAETKKEWALANCYTNGLANSLCVNDLTETLNSQGSAAMGTVSVFLRKIDAKEYELQNEGNSQGILTKEVVTTDRYDGNGNVLESVENISSGLDVGSVEKITTNDYEYTGSTWSMWKGRLKRLTSVSSNSSFGAITRVSAFEYYQTGSEIGLLKTETIEPDNAEFTVATTHTYYLGNRTSSSTTADGQTRQSEVTYDDRGRYIDKTYDFFTNGTNVNTPIKYLASLVVSRDKYGLPTLIKRYYSASAYTTLKTATSAFGSPYFEAASTGEFTETQMGVGLDEAGICSNDTATWIVVRVAGGAKAIKCLDLLGRIRREGKLGFNGAAWNLVDTEYNYRGLVERSSAPYASNTSDRYWTTFSYDILGRTTEIEEPYKNSTVSTTKEYGALTVKVTNPKNQVRIEKRDLMGKVIEVTDSNYGITKFAYDARGNMREMRDPAQNTTVIGYDLRDRKVTMSDLDKGSWTYTYNRFNELTCQKDGKGQVITMDYDVHGRMVNRIERPTCSGSGVYFGTYWVYDKASNGLGQLESIYTTPVNIPEFRQRFKYDSRGRLSTKETSFLGHLDEPTTHNEKIVYDQYNRVYQQFDAAREVNSFESNGLQNAYNAQGYLYKVMDAVGYGGVQQTYYTISEQDARGHVTQALYGNGVTQVADFEPETGLASNIQAYRALPLSAIQDMHLEWDEVGNLSSRSEKGTAGESAQRNINEYFGYDSLNRLNSWTTSGDITASDSAEYDSINNIRLKSGMSYSYGRECGSGTNAGPHAVCRVGGSSYYYDKNGNQTSGSGRVIQYIHGDLPWKISFGLNKTQFAYDPMHARYKRVDTQSDNQVTTTLYIGSVEKVFYPDGTIEWRRGIAGVGQITQTLNAKGVVSGEAQRYFLKDHLGSISLITDEIGAVEQANYFDPWGAERKVVSSGSIKQWLLDSNSYRVGNKPITTRGFTGHEHLAEVGLIHMNGRIYDAKLARFVQADPVLQDPLRIQSLNRYSYVWNNPLNATDPSGFVCNNSGDGDSCDTKKKPTESPNSNNDETTTSTDKNESSGGGGNKKVKELDKGGCYVNVCYYGVLPKGVIANGTSTNSTSNSTGVHNSPGSNGGNSKANAPTSGSQSGRNSAAATEATNETNNEKKREELSRDGKIRFINIPYKTADKATLEAYKEYEDDYFNIGNDQELLGVIFKYRGNFYYTTPAIVPADTKSEPTPLTVSGVPEGASQYRNYHTHPEGNLIFSGADLRGVNETGIPMYLRNMNGDVKLLEGIPLTGKTICERCLSPLPQKH